MKKILVAAFAILSASSSAFALTVGDSSTYSCEYRQHPRYEVKIEVAEIDEANNSVKLETKSTLEDEPRTVYESVTGVLAREKANREDMAKNCGQHPGQEITQITTPAGTFTACKSRLLDRPGSLYSADVPMGTVLARYNDGTGCTLLSYEWK